MKYMETANAAPESFANTPEFGRFIAEVRSGQSRRRIEEAGGPSERHQQDIEAGKEMPITARIRAQYRQALRDSETGLGDYFDAACAAFNGAQHTPERSPYDEPWPLYAGGGFLVGDLTRPGATITVGALISGSSFGPDTAGTCGRALWRHLDGDRAFTSVACRIATSHGGITVMPWPPTGATKVTTGDLWPSHRIYRVGTTYDAGFPRLFIDPLREVKDLEKAYLRAAALGAADNDRAHLAWAVLLANGAAAQAGTNPLQSWINLFAAGTAGAEELSRWRTLIDQLSTDTGVTTTITVDDVITTAQRYLLPWTEDWLAANGLRFNAFEEAGGTQLSWSLSTGSHARAEWSAEDSDHVPVPQLWLCDPAMLKAVPTILTDRNVGSLVLNDRELAVPGSPHPQFVWCPVGAGDRYAVLREVGTNQWRSAVLY